MTAETDTPARARLETTWGSNDPDLAAMLKSINDEPDLALRLELMAGLHTWQAQKCIRDAERHRMYQNGYIRRPRKRETT